MIIYFVAHVWKNFFMSPERVSIKTFKVVTFKKSPLFLLPKLIRRKVIILFCTVHLEWYETVFTHYAPSKLNQMLFYVKPIILDLNFAQNTLGYSTWIKNRVKCVPRNFQQQLKERWTHWCSHSTCGLISWHCKSLLFVTSDTDRRTCVSSQTH